MRKRGVGALLAPQVPPVRMTALPMRPTTIAVPSGAIALAWSSIAWVVTIDHAPVPTFAQTWPPVVAAITSFAATEIVSTFASVNASLVQLAPSQCRTPLTTSRSEEHTSELQSLRHLVCRLLLEKKK